MNWAVIILPHLSLNFGPMSDNQSLSNMSYVAWAQIVFYIGISIALIILRSKKTKYQKLTSKYTIEELVSKLNAKYSNLPPMGIVYGRKKTL
jgi:hypothetical protein